MKKNNVKKIGILCFILFLFGLPIISSAIEGSLSNGITGLKLSTSANFYAISESELTTRWILQNTSLTPVEDFTDDINIDYWNLIDVSENNFTAFLTESYLLDNISMITPIEEVQYTGTHFDTSSEDNECFGITWDGTYFWIVGEIKKEVYKYYSNGTYTGTHFDVGAQDAFPQGIVWDGSDFWMTGFGNSEVYQYNTTGDYTGVHFDTFAQDRFPHGITWDGSHFWIAGWSTAEVYQYNSTGDYTGVHFDTFSEDVAIQGLVWDGTYFWAVGDQNNEVYQYNSTGDYTGVHFYVGSEDQIPAGIMWDGSDFWMVGVGHAEVYKYEPKYDVSKNYFGDGYIYMQTNETELISLKSVDYTTHYNLSSGDYFEVDFQTSSDSKIELILLKDGGVNKTLTLSQSGNDNFNRHTVQISVDETVEFDQLKISSTFEDEDYVKVYDVKTYKYTIVGDYADFYVSPNNQRDVNLTCDTYNLRIFDPYDGDVKVDVNITIGASGYSYVYASIKTLDCRLTLFNTENDHLEFTDYHISINRSLNGEWDVFNLLDNIFTADVESHVYINVSDRFDTIIDSFDKIASSYIDIELDVYSLQIKNLMEQRTTVDINTTHVYQVLYGESIYFMLSKAYYQIRFLDEYNIYKNFTIYLNSNQAYQLNSSLKTIYFSMFTYDGLGIDHDLVRFYINTERKDLGFNSMLEDSLELVILDFFNNTLANETIDANAYDNSEYNLYVQIYSMYILNQFTYNDLIVNITQDGSGMWMNQLIPSTSALLYRFIPNVNYTINATYINGTVYSIRTINLTDNSQIESFGVPSVPEEYPKDVYFGIYTTTGLGINHNLLRFYIDGTITDFGFNRITDEIITITVKDYFNTTLFNQVVNTSGIYEYNILITLNSLKIKNEARVLANYTLKRGGLETTGYILPEEIIEYQLSSNNYVFDYTNNEDNSFHTININLNQDRVYVLNSTYYNTYFSLYDQNGVRLDDPLFSLYLNGTRKDFGFVELGSADVLIVVQDYLNFTVFNSVITLDGLTEYNIIIMVFELQIRHLAQENSNLTIFETTTHNYINFSMSPDSLNKYTLSGSTYNITWINGENSISTVYDITLDENYILTLDSTYYDIYFSLFDLNLHIIDPQQYEFRLNGTLQDLGFIEDLSTDDYTIMITDRFGTSLFNSIVNLRGLNEYRINVSLYELQISHLARENGNLTLSETTSHNSLDFNMSPISLRSFILGSSTYNITWINNENGVTTTYDINLNSDYILTLNTSYYDVYIGLYNFYGIVNAEEVKFYINGTRANFGFNTIKSEYITLTVLDYFNSTLYNQVVRLEGLTEYSIFVRAYTLVVNNLYKNQSITIKMTRGTITLERLIEAQGQTEFKLFANTIYEIVSYVNGINNETNEVELIEDEIKEVVLDEEYKTVDFGFFETDVTISPEPILPPDMVNFLVFLLVLIPIIMIVVGSFLYSKIRKGANRTTKATTHGEYIAFPSFMDSLKTISRNKVVLLIIFILAIIGTILFFTNVWW